MSGFLAVALLAVAYIVFVLLLLAAGRHHAARRARREAAAARHPSRQARRRKVPGLPVDGEPLNEEDLAKFTAIMTPPVSRPNQARKTTSDEGAE